MKLFLLILIGTFTIGFFIWYVAFGYALIIEAKKILERVEGIYSMSAKSEKILEKMDRKKPNSFYREYSPEDYLGTSAVKHACYCGKVDPDYPGWDFIRTSQYYCEKCRPRKCAAGD